VGASLKAQLAIEDTSYQREKMGALFICFVALLCVCAVLCCALLASIVNSFFII
jgi:hypothetical protein